MSGQDELRVKIFEQIDELQATTSHLAHQDTDEGSEAKTVISDDLNVIRYAVGTTDEAETPIPATKEPDEAEG